jgi:hypothetical protein
MTTCENCIHHKVCADFYDDTIEASTGCPFYKDRSRFVELPCKVGTTVYTVSLKHGVVPWSVYAICSTVNEWDAALKITLLARSKKIDKSAKFSANAVSTSVFFTRKEAEQALKERESGA